jgi:hypothetical protein
LKASVLWLGLAACAQSTGPGVGAPPGSSRHSSTTFSGSHSSTSGSGSTGGGSTSSGGSSTGGTSGGGSSSGAACSGAVLTSSLTDLLGALAGTPQPISGAQIAAVAVDGVPIGGEATLSGASGAFALCVAPGQEFATQIQATGYASAYLEDLKLAGDYTTSTISLAQTSTLQAFAVDLPGFVTTDAFIVAGLSSTSGQPPCSALGNWAFSATLPDGGAIAFQNAYLGRDGLPHLSTKTDSTGVGFLYNIDPSVTDAVLVTATQVDGGAFCPINDGGPFTGRVVIGPGTVSSAPLILP